MRGDAAMYPTRGTGPLHIPEKPLDVLAQQIVAAAAVEEWKEDDLFDLVDCGVSVPASDTRGIFGSAANAERRFQHETGTARGADLL